MILISRIFSVYSSCEYDVYDDVADYCDGVESHHKEYYHIIIIQQSCLVYFLKGIKT